MTSDRLSYTFGPLERRGLLGPLRAGQLACLAPGAMLAIASLDRWPTVGGAVLATLALGLSVAIAIWPLGRRSLQEWAPVALAFIWQRARRRTHFRSAAPSRGTFSTGGQARRPVIRSPVPHPPPSLRRVQIESLPYGGKPVGVVTMNRGRRMVAILACRVIAFSLLDDEAQERRLARWGLVLSGVAGTSVRRLQWVERTAPSQGDELARWLATERDPAVPLRGTSMIDSYLDLISSTTKVSQDHEILVAIEVDAHRVRERGPTAARTSLLEQTERIARGLEAAEVRVLGALGPGQVARALRTAFDPYARAELAALEAFDPAHDAVTEAGAWPIGADEAWEHYRTDGAFHATYWIGSWPRVDVSPMFMDALLGGSDVVRTVAVTFEPLSIERSTREVEAAITRDRADRDLRRRFGQSETARQRQVQEAAVRRESELAAGHGEVRLAGFVTLTGRDLEDLGRACSLVHEHAARARLELHRMYGQQADAFTFTLPLCRGLR
jgi:Putative type VII ESX secretion system translocon, EccE